VLESGSKRQHLATRSLTRSTTIMQVPISTPPTSFKRHLSIELVLAKSLVPYERSYAAAPTSMHLPSTSYLCVRERVWASRFSRTHNLNRPCASMCVFNSGGKHSCLVLAVRANSLEIVRLLVDAKADPTLGTPSPLELAFERREARPEIHELLLAAAAAASSGTSTTTSTTTSTPPTS